MTDFLLLLQKVNELDTSLEAVFGKKKKNLNPCFWAMVAHIHSRINQVFIPLQQELFPS